MKTRELFKKGAELFSKYKKELWVYFVVLAIILSLSLMLSILFGIWFILIFFILFPLQFGLNYIIRKMGDNLDVKQNDIYLGFKQLKGSLAIGAKTNLRGFGFGLLASVIVTVLFTIVIVISLYVLEPVSFNAILEATDAETIYTIMLNIDWVNELITAASIVSILAAVFIYCVTGLPANMAEFACFDAPLTPDGGVTASRRTVKKHSKQYLGINLLFALMILVAFGIGYLFYFLTNGSIFINQYLVALIMSFIIGCLWSLIYLYYLTVKYEFYNAYGKKEVQLMVDEFKAAAEELKKINEERLNKGKKEEK